MSEWLSMQFGVSYGCYRLLSDAFASTKLLFGHLRVTKRSGVLQSIICSADTAIDLVAMKR